MSKIEPNKKFELQWWKWPLIVIGFLHIVSVPFWIIHLILLANDKKKGFVLSARGQLSRTAYITCLANLVIIGVFMILALL